MQFTDKQKKVLCAFLAAFVILIGFGCGGGGGGGGSDGGSSGGQSSDAAPGGGSGGGPGGSSANVFGVGFKGPIVGGTVNVYQSDADASQGALIGTTTTDAYGHYYPPIDLGSYSGDVLIEISGGQYEDEATGLIVDNGDGVDDVVLHAAVTGVSGTISVMVTPFTEIAYRLVVAGLTVDEANYLVGTMTGVSNIVRTEPALVTEDGICDTALPSQLEYGLLMAMISQWIADADPPMTLDDAMQAIADDLADNQLDMIGGELTDALMAFMASVQNKSCIDDEGQTLIDEAILEITTNPVVIPADASSYIKTKQLIGDFRDTVQTIYNYKDYGVRGIMETPFKNFAEELQNGIIPELTDTFGRIGWIIRSAQTIVPPGDPGATYVFDSGDGLMTLTLISTGDGFDFHVVEDATSTLIDDGWIVKLSSLSGIPEAGSSLLEAAMGTASGPLTMDVSLEITSVEILPQVTIGLSGSMIADGLTVTLRDTSQMTIPLDSLDPPIPDRVFISGSIETNTVVMQGDLDLSSFVDNLVPSAFTFEGSFQPIDNPTGALFSGVVTGSWTNAATFDPSVPIGETNFRQWSATFNGQIAESGAVPARSTITTLLTVTQSEYDVFTLGAGYWRTNPDGTVVFLSGDGKYWDDPDDFFDFKVLTLNLTNQDGLVVDAIVSWDAADPAEKLSGTIETLGGLQTGRLMTKYGGIPWVEYIEGDTVVDDEPIF